MSLSDLIFDTKTCLLSLLLLMVILQDAQAGSSNGASASYGGQPSQKCGVPLSLPIFPLEPLKMAGFWYVYMIYDGAPVPATKNGFNNYTPLGSLDGAPAAQVMNWTTNYRALSDSSCSGIFVDSVFTTDGQRNGFTWRDSNNYAKPSYTAARFLYTDYTTVEIWTQCYVANLTSGECAFAHIETLTRQNPNQLSSSTVAFIRDQINRAVASFCLSADDFIVAETDDSLPACSIPKPPAFTAALDSLSQLLNTKRSNRKLSY